MTIRYFFGKRRETENTWKHTFAVLISDVFLWKVSWQRNEQETRMPEEYRIEAGKVDSITETGLNELTEIREEDVKTVVNIEKDFTSWALSSYQNYLARNPDPKKETNGRKRKNEG